MEHLDVEPVDDLEMDVPTGIDAPEYVLLGGKGGVGKTTMAAATALASASDGTRTLVVSTDPAHSLSDTFETEIPPEPTRIREDVPLYAAEIDPDEALAEEGLFGAGGGGEAAGAAGGPFGGLEELFGGENPMEALLGGGSMPGADEAVAMRQLLAYLDDERFDRVVVDTAPTGHTLRLLELPELMDTMLGRVIEFRQRLRGMLSGMKDLFGGEEPPEDDLVDVRELRARIERLRATLRDPAQTDFRIVVVPEEMSIVESKRLLARLTEFEIPVSTIVVNRVMEDLADVTGEPNPDWFVSPDIEGCAFCERRWKVQQGALASAQELFQGRDVRRVPLFADEVRGEPMLRLVANCLE